MSKITSYAKLIIFSLLVLSGVQVPGFVTEYGKNLEARLSESKQNIKPFQDTANQHFEGNINKLIAHYNNQNDSVFSEGGDSIETIYNRFTLLNNSLQQFQKSSYDSYSQTFFSPIADIRSQVWKNYNFNIQLNKDSILFGLIFAIALTLIVEILGWFFGKLFRNNKAAYA